MSRVSEEETHVNKKSVYDNLADNLEWFACDYLSCFRIFALCHDCTHNKNNNDNISVAISQTASDIILHQSDINIHPLHE